LPATASMMSSDRSRRSASSASTHRPISAFFASRQRTSSRSVNTGTQRSRWDVS